MIIGREEELGVLKEAFEAEESQFVAVYGRRRVGKTYLIRECFGERITFQHAGLAKGGQAIQLAAFCDSLARAGGRIKRKPANWLQAFSLLMDFLSGSRTKRKVVFLDELSWMSGGRGNGLLVALEYFWNTWASARKDIVLIVSSSSTSWMLNRVVHDKGGFYHRLNRKIPLHPFTLAECAEFSRKSGLGLSNADVLRAYMVFGGVPFYWTLLKKGMNIAQDFDALCFAKSGELRDEFDYLLGSLFARPKVYVDIVVSLGSSRQGLSRLEIMEAIKAGEGGDVSSKLRELEACGYIREYRPCGKKKKDSLFQLIDPFVLFYLRFMQRHPTDERFFQHNIKAPKVTSWMGLAFEIACLNHVGQLKAALGISGVATECSSWRCRADEDLGVSGHQIDLLIERADGVVNLCEMKYSAEPYVVTNKEESDWSARVDDFIKATGTNETVQFTLVTPYGLKKNTHSWVVQNVIEMTDLFK